MTNFDKGHTKYGLVADANLISAILGSMQNIREKDIEAAYVLIDNATEPTLDQVNKGSVADVKHSMYMAYDDQGRIVAQRRAGNVGKPAGGEYIYEAGSNKLKSVTNGMGGTADSRNMTDANNFDYDADGNLIEDKSKNLTISYDWRGMPVEFVRETCTAYGHYTVCDSTKLVMAYDGSGRRISKTRMKKTAFDGPWYATLVTHYTGIGTEVRENMPGGTLKDVRVVVNMPQGLGRYMPEDASAVDIGFGAGYIPSEKFEWYLKNHLGSTMLVYGTQGYSWTDVADVGVPVAAYDYRAFGEQVSLAEPAEKVTENFTGKERDDEIELNYFGARYLDPSLGLWTSVDPARQFSSPYLYAGNGYNPINGVDGDGNYFNYADKATEHAVMQYVQHISPEAKFRFNQLAASKYRYDIMKVDGAQIDPDDGETVGGLARPWTYENGESGGAAYFSNIDFFLHEVLAHLYDVDNSLKGNFGDVNATAKEIDLNRNEWEERAREFEKQTTEDVEDE